MVLRNQGGKTKKGPGANPRTHCTYMAGATGLEPATSGVTGRRSNQTELHPRIGCFLNHGGRNRARTCDFNLVRVALYQLSYSPFKKRNSIINNR